MSGEDTAQKQNRLYVPTPYPTDLCGMENGSIVSWVRDATVPDPRKCAELGKIRTSPPRGYRKSDFVVVPDDEFKVFRNPSRGPVAIFWLFELAKSLKKLQAEHHYPSLATLGKAVGWSGTQVQDHLNLLELPADLQAELEQLTMHSSLVPSHKVLQLARTPHLAPTHSRLRDLLARKRGEPGSIT